MKILITTGGSGGHIYPAVSLIKYLSKHNHEVLFVGSSNKMENDICKRQGINFKGLDIANRYKPFKFAFSLIKSLKPTRRIIKDFNPDVIVSFGNYISLPVSIIASLKSIPIILHEQNVVMGKANKLLALFARYVVASFPLSNYNNKKVRVLGNPRSSDCVSLETKIGEFSHSDKKNILIFMGSLGSSTINKTLKELTTNNLVDYDYLIITGKGHYLDFINDLVIPDNVKVVPYLDNMLLTLKKTDLVISRAGATTLAELSALGIASILVPSPYVVNNHQYLNAKYMEDNGASIILEEKDFNLTNLHKNIRLLMGDNALRIRMRLNALKLASFKANEKITKLLEEVSFSD